MNLHEYQAKEIFARYGIPIPQGELASSPEAAFHIAERLSGKVVVKAQVLVGGRGKAGGVKLASSPREAESLAGSILGMSIRGEVVRKILIAPVAEIQQELYLGITVDRVSKRAVMMVSSLGGVDIEEAARTHPEKIARAALDPFLGLRAYQARELAQGIGLDKDLWPSFIATAQGVYRAFVECDASLAEINPLALTPHRKLVALDAKLVLDDNALYRHLALASLRDVEAEAPQEREARENGISYVKMQGNIGCLVNGAGLAMTTMDVIKLYGGEPANFLDVGGGASAQRVAQALRILFSDPQVRAVLINIFGGITRCDEVARGLIAALEEVKTTLPIIVRLVGTNEAEGRKILAAAKLETADSLAEAAQKAVAAPQANPQPQGLQQQKG